MKKILSGLILTLLLAGLIVPALVSAQEGLPQTCTVTNKKVTDAVDFCTTSGTVAKGAKINVELFPMCCLFNTIYTVTDWVFYILLIIVVFMMVLGGFYFVTAAGDPERATKGRQLIVYALIGLVIALLARLIPAAVRFILGV